MSRQYKSEEYNDFLVRIYPEKSDKFIAKSVTFVVTNRCSLACTYCYQHNKSDKRMSFEVAKKFIDGLLSGDKGYGDYVDSDAIVLDFIGGEPLLEIELIDKIVDYFRARTLELNHRWKDNFMISICSNGVAYRDEKVQNFLRKNSARLSFSVTLDGHKELHDSCRVFPDGKGSYDYAYDACMDWMNKGNFMGSKITLCPDNVMYTYEAVKHMLEMGYYNIHINGVYEEGWNDENAGILYNELKKVADYILNNYNPLDIAFAMFDEAKYKPMNPEENNNWCGGNGLMLACGTDGRLYPCVRYVESSLGEDVKPIVIGTVDDGIATKPEYKNDLDCVSCITRRSQSTDECFNCPIAQGCGWCTALNYEITGTPDKRLTNICPIQKAQSLANAYYWNKYYSMYGLDKRLEVNCPEEWAIHIIGKEDYDSLIKMSRGEI